jgi:hypothetical protein
MTGPELEPAPAPPGGEEQNPFTSLPPTAAAARSRKPLIIGGIVAAVVILAVVITVVLVSPGSGSPQRVVQDYIAAAKSGDRATMQDLTCAKYKGLITQGVPDGSPNSFSDALGNVDFQVGNASVSGDTAVVQLKITYSGPLPGGSDLPNSISIGLPLVKEGGAWKVCTSS